MIKMKLLILSFLKALSASFTTSPGKPSSRKLSAFVAVALSIVITLKYCTSEVLTDTLTVWLLFGLLCMGLVTFTDIISFKSGRDNNQDKTNG